MYGVSVVSRLNILQMIRNRKSNIENDALATRPEILEAARRYSQKARARM